jgi:hypothetical protein
VARQAGGQGIESLRPEHRQLAHDEEAPPVAEVLDRLVKAQYSVLAITNAATLGGCQNADSRCRGTAVGSVISVKVRERRTTELMEESE